MRPVGDAPGGRADPRGSRKGQWGGEGGLRCPHPKEVGSRGALRKQVEVWMAWWEAAKALVKLGQ